MNPQNTHRSPQLAITFRANTCCPTRTAPKYDLLGVSVVPVALRRDTCNHAPHNLLDDGQVKFFLAQQSQLAAVP